MNNFFLETDEFFRHLINIPTSTNSKIDIITFNMRADDFNEDPHPINELLEKVATTNHRIIVGVPKLTECVPGCPHCRKKYNKNIYRLNEYAEQMNIRFISASHIKYYRIDDKQFIGGMNLSPSGWLDYMQETDNKELPNKFEQLWKEAASKAEFVLSNPDEPMSDKQRNFVENIEEALGIESGATNKYEAGKFINEHINAFYKKQGGSR